MPFASAAASRQCPFRVAERFKNLSVTSDSPSIKEGKCCVHPGYLSPRIPHEEFLSYSLSVRGLTLNRADSFCDANFPVNRHLTETRLGASFHMGWCQVGVRHTLCPC